MRKLFSAIGMLFCAVYILTYFDLNGGVGVLPSLDDIELFVADKTGWLAAVGEWLSGLSAFFQS